jgi:hypothetical protein
MRTGAPPKLLDGRGADINREVSSKYRLAGALSSAGLLGGKGSSRRSLRAMECGPSRACRPRAFTRGGGPYRRQGPLCGRGRPPVSLPQRSSPLPAVRQSNSSRWLYASQDSAPPRPGGGRGPLPRRRLRLPPPEAVRAGSAGGPAPLLPAPGPPLTSAARERGPQGDLSDRRENCWPRWARRRGSCPG